MRNNFSKEKYGKRKYEKLMINLYRFKFKVKDNMAYELIVYYGLIRSYAVVIGPLDNETIYDQYEVEVSKKGILYVIKECYMKLLISTLKKRFDKLRKGQ